MADRLADEVQRLRRLIEAAEDKAAMHELAENLNSIGIYQWAEAPRPWRPGDRKGRPGGAEG